MRLMQNSVFGPMADNRNEYVFTFHFQEIEFNGR